MKKAHTNVDYFDMHAGGIKAEQAKTSSVCGACVCRKKWCSQFPKVSTGSQLKLCSVLLRRRRLWIGKRFRGIKKMRTEKFLVP